MDDSNSRLRAKLKASEAKEAHVRSELADLKGHLRRQTQESEALRGEVAKLKHMLTVRIPSSPYTAYAMSGWHGCSCLPFSWLCFSCHFSTFALLLEQFTEMGQPGIDHIVLHEVQ